MRQSLIVLERRVPRDMAVLAARVLQHLPDRLEGLHWILCVGSGRPCTGRERSKQVTSHANDTHWAESGSARTGLPFLARIALASAGAITGVAGSPTPVGFSFEATITVSMRGIWFMRTTG